MTDLPLRQGVARAFGIGGVRQQGQNSAVAIVRKTVEIGGFPRGGGSVDFKIAGMDKSTYRRAQGKADAVHDAVGHPDKVERKRPQVQALPGLDQVQSRHFQETVLL